MQKIKAKIHLGNICRNAELFLALTGKKLCAVVKANAYGHGAEFVVNALESYADCFAVALLSEALEIRLSACGKDILVFTPPITEMEALAFIDNGFIATVESLSTAKLLTKVCRERQKPARVHLKINTGMNRYGLDLTELDSVCELLTAEGVVQVQGVYSHLYAYSLRCAYGQKALFEQALARAKEYFPNVTAHLGGTYGALLGREFLYDMARIGIGLYGYLPDGAQDMRNIPTLRKGMTVYAPVVATRSYAFGGAGYGSPLVTPNVGDELCVCRYGYADGFLRSFNNGVFGWKAQINNLCMDACLRKSSLKQGSWVPVLVDAAETARNAATISYEVLCAATRRAEFEYDWD